MIFRKATMADVPHIHRLINHYAQQGLMLRRPLMRLYESVRDFAVAEDGGAIMGTGGLHMLWHDLAEIRSLSVHPDRVGQGIGRGLVEFMLAEAQGLAVPRVFAFTYKPGFFAKCGFAVVKKEILPQKVWKECVYCDKFHDCDEIAVINYLSPGARPPQEEEIPLVDVPRWKVD
ncbi:MAG: N-acetyltransferase [Clostridia bacterium]|nr:MAG: N-acetyltransferase [Clostridia bacterium]